MVGNYHVGCGWSVGFELFNEISVLAFLDGLRVVGCSLSSVVCWMGSWL